MKLKLIGSAAILLSITLGYFLFNTNSARPAGDIDDPEFESKEDEAKFTYERWKYEADMIKDPTTGQALFGLREQEIAFAKTIPLRNGSLSTARMSTQNTYFPAGPNNQGGRCRALAYDVRYNGTSNRVIIAGGVSGGLFRSTDGGSTWSNVTPQDGIPNIGTVAQDPRPGNQDIWYAGGGEYVGSSPDALGALYLAHGVFKSTDNGATWSRLPLNNITDYNGALIGSGVAERFDHPFDYVHRIAVNPVNGDVYVACHRKIVRSSNGGSTFQTVFGSGTNAFAPNGQTDVAISPTGKIYVAMTGSNSDFALRGIWKSPTGNLNSYTRLAGGATLGTDSVANWRGNSYNFFLSGGANYYDPRRTLLAVAPSNENILYVVYENGLTNTSTARNKEADLFRLDMTSGNNWVNQSANVPDFPGGDHDATDPFTIQFGYDLFITVKPDNPNFVILGGSSLYRSTDGFSSTSATSWIGGYGNTLPSLTFYTNSHPDIHNVVFNPSSANFREVICANDGGLQMTSDITAPGSTVAWTNLNNFQTLQYYAVAIDPEMNANNFVGGSQDNGTHFRDKTGIAGTAAGDSNNHKRMIGGDGATAAISKRISNNQYLFGSTQYGTLRRGIIQANYSPTTITPNGLTPAYPGATSEYGEFVTNFKLDQDNTEDLYYINFNRLFRATNSYTVSASSGWTELTGVSSAVNPGNPSSGMNVGIRALALSYGGYNTSHSLYIGTTDGKVFRLDNPRNAIASTTPADISPPSSVADMTFLNVQSIAVNPNNDNEIIIVTTPYGRTNGAGVFQNVPNILWCGNAKSSSPTWKVAEGNLAGTTNSGFISARSCMITVKKDASNNDVTEYYVGTAAGLFATENLGTTLQNNQSPTWQREGAGILNYAVISSLAYRPSDNVLLVGTHGNGMYYTFLGTPNLVTGINDPVINDKNFISLVYPTITSSFVNYTTGNKTDVKKISVQLIDLTGKIAYWQETGYQNGSIDISRFAKGAYILSIYSDNRKYRHVQKIIR